eukprot:CAMPEP_0195069864 /NCGR_PEP_ID=MMETSP0448-20130528/14072_1 /TAXON_ID=66468 /ORGANISM="Heterocapsa triquestra, Strain CCMP 448" /LENGTH=76 /DNA_ID=CAMNT_0040101515 /DNA_START=54 /DNA_END=281 /DNA_ORIENTATION=-
MYSGTLRTLFTDVMRLAILPPITASRTGSRFTRGGRRGCMVEAWCLLSPSAKHHRAAYNQATKAATTLTNATPWEQ